jgi:hypothetical protein
MAEVHGEVVIHRAIEEVFDFVADMRYEPRYNPRMVRVEKLTDGSIGRGTRFLAQTRSFGRPVSMTVEFTEYKRPRRLGSRTRTLGLDIEGVLTFEPVPDGTRLRWSWVLKPRGLLVLLGPAVAWMGQRQEQAIWTGLKRALEA